MSAFPAITSNERFDVLLLLSLSGSVQPTVWMVSALIVSRPGSHLISQQIFYFFKLLLDVQGSIFICILSLPTFPFLISDTGHHTTSGTPESTVSHTAAFVVASPWSLSPEHKSNSDAAELRTLSSLMGSQIISSGIFSLLTLTIPLEILSFHPQYNFWTNPVIGRRAGKRRDYCWPHVWAHVYTWCSTRTDNFCALVWVRGLCFHPSCNEISCEVSLMRSFKCGITPATL